MFGIIVKVTEMEKDTNLSLSKLFHYTYSIDNLLGILKDGFKIKYSLEKLGLFDNEENNLTDEFAIPMICFCDIPLNLVKQHISVYGNFAIGLKKEWGEKQAICPIIYLPKYGETKVLLENAVRNINKNNNKIREIKNSLTNINQEMTMIDVINFYDDFIDFTMYVKPYIGNFERKTIGFNDPNYKFYDEREWRYKPNKRLRQLLVDEEITIVQGLKLVKKKNHNRPFVSAKIDLTTDVIEYIIISSFMEYKEFKQSLRKIYIEDNDYELMLSKIICAERIIRDF